MLFSAKSKTETKATYLKVQGNYKKNYGLAVKNFSLKPLLNKIIRLKFIFNFICFTCLERNMTIILKIRKIGRKNYV